MRHGYNVEDVGSTQSFDLLASRTGGTGRRVEVNSITSTGHDIVLASNEMALDRENAHEGFGIAYSMTLDRAVDSPMRLAVPWSSKPPGDRRSDWCISPMAIRLAYQCIADGKGISSPAMNVSHWGTPDPNLVAWIERHQSQVLTSYGAQPKLVQEHANLEDQYRTGGYATRQVLELAQNAADALDSWPKRGRIELRLTENALYCANEGRPFDLKGVEAVSYAHLSNKRGGEMGRFGLGFKSVLGITSCPTIFSRSISIGFDQTVARERLRTVAPSATNFPVLRWPLQADPVAEMNQDAVLEELAQWASTVVRLPLNADASRLRQDLRDFPAEFLLFAPQVASLAICCTDPTDPFDRTLRCERSDEHSYHLTGGGTSAEWLVWHREHHPSDEALNEVGEALRREQVTISYAVPLDDATSVGRFWSYFPLNDQTSARGIHNAPWRVSDDRTTLLSGTFNNELLDVLGTLIVEAMPALSTPQDPARHFDYLPARGREAQYDADKYLTELIPTLARKVPCVPDGTGELRMPSELTLLNTDMKLEHQSFELWQRLTTAPSTSPHSSCYTTTTRRSRLQRLVRHDERRAARNEIGGGEWLELLLPAGTDQQCRAALDVFFSVTDESLRRDLRSARIVPDQADLLHDLNKFTSLFISGGILSGAAGFALMRPSYVDDELTVTRLKKIGFTEVDPSVELRQLLRVANRKWTSSEWHAFWELILNVPVNVADEALAAHAATGGEMRVKARSGKWVVPYAAVLSGVVDPVSADLAIDHDYHEDHRPQLSRIGTGGRPVASEALLHDLTYLEYVRLRREAYLKNVKVAPRPTAAALHFLSGEAVGPLYVLQRFRDTRDDDAAAAWTRELLEFEASSMVQFGHLNNQRFPPVEVRAPHVWAATKYGLVDTCWGPRPADSAVDPNLAQYRPLLPVADYEAASKITSAKSLDQVPDAIWAEFLSRVPDGGTSADLGRLLAIAARRDSMGTVTAQTLPAVVGETYSLVSAADLLVASTDEERRVLDSDRRPHVVVFDPADAEAVCERFGCRLASEMLRVEYTAENPSESIAVLDRFSGLRRRAEGSLDGWTIVTATDVVRAVITTEGTSQDSVDIAFVEGDLGRQIIHSTDLDDDELLGLVSQRFGLSLDPLSIEKVLDDTQDQRVRLKVAGCRSAPDVPTKLRTLLSDAALESRLPAGLLQVVRASSDDLGPNHVAELLHHVYGYSVLVELKNLLTDEGFDTPAIWAGSQGAVGFVRSLGFPMEYAGSSSATLAPELTVLGPPGLPDLHVYQEQLRDEICTLLRSDPADRALLYLPTGAGKTRVTVQAIVESIIANEIQGPVLWIAQTEELCEQAVQTFSTVWREFGDRALKLYRLWSKNEVADSDDDVCVIVATDAKLASIKARDEYQWLPRRTHAVVVDEAHGSIASGITDTLRWLGIDNKAAARPFLGLTATPFRSSVDASKSLMRRFGGRLLDVLGDDPYEALQDLGVLARVKHAELAGGEFRLEASELPHYEKFHDVPRTVLDRIGKDQARTQALVQHIETLPEDWPVLVFTASVLSAQILAALLRVSGITAASVSGSTPVYERRRTIEDFREGRIRVLTNCNVLTEGFDAPAVRALYIARPTFSPNAYIQMIGRGLRGPKNGGKEECLVVNIADTFAQFKDSLAYKKFNYLWSPVGGESS